MEAATIIPEAPPSFTATEACQLAGITYRQLDYAARSGLVVPSIREADGSGTHRLYSSYDVAQLKVYGRLSALGFRAGTVPHVGVAELLDHLLFELHALEPLAKGSTHAPAPDPDPPDHAGGH